MKSLLLVAHGSRREASNEEVRQLTRKLCELASGRFSSINCAFLELAEPSIPKGIDEALATGSDELIVFPYFLSAGRHVSKDIPDIIATKQQEYTDKKIEVTMHLGVVEGVAELILGSLGEGEA